MKLPFATREELLKSLAEDERDSFVFGLPGDRRAVLVTDPDDCGPIAKAKRMTVSAVERKEGMISELTQDVAHSAATGVLNIFVSGLGDNLANAAQLNELNKLRAYRDVCDLTPEERTVLFEGNVEPPKKAEPSLFDKASKFFSR